MFAHLHAELEKLAGHHILCVGDVMLDRFIYGAVERISPEAPIPVLRVNREQMTLGGAGNVVRNVVALGGHVDLVGVIGHDQAGYDVSDQIASMPEVVSYVITDNARPTTIKTRFIASSQQLLRADNELSAPLSKPIEDQALMRMRGAIGGCDVIILSDYAKGVLTDRVIKESIKMARENNKPILIDPKGRDFSRYNGAFMLTPNRKELTEATGMSVKTIEEAESAARKLIADHNLGGILAKLGGDGICLIMKDKPAQHFRVSAREVYDVSGAGDTVVATMALAIAGGMSLEDGAALANIAGTAVVAKVGTATISREDLGREILRDQSHISEAKIMTRDQMLDTAAKWRQQNYKIGFTNGCFDLIHPGHLSLIRQAREACDRLVLGLNSDSSTRRLKGEGRPIQNESARAAVLAALTDIDCVTIFSEDTPTELIKVLKPDVLVKGANYSTDEVVGADLLKEWGGKVMLADLIEGQSTKSTIQKLKG